VPARFACAAGGPVAPAQATGPRRLAGMSAPADDILTAVKAAVEAAFPGQTCHVRRASDRNPALWFDCRPPCWLVSANDDRPTEMAWSGAKFVRYVLRLEYVTRELPGDRGASPGVEAALDRAARLFLAPRRADGSPGLQGVAGWNDAEVRPLAPYQMPFQAQTASVSGLRLEIETLEDA